MTDLAALTLWELSEHIRRKEVSPVEATRRYLDLVAGRALKGRRLRVELGVRDLPRLTRRSRVVIAPRCERPARTGCAGWTSCSAGRVRRGGLAAGPDGTRLFGDGPAVR